MSVPMYVVCNRLIDAEANRHCEFDGIVNVGEVWGNWVCPMCKSIRHSTGYDLYDHDEAHDLGRQPTGDIA